MPEGCQHTIESMRAAFGCLEKRGANLQLVVAADVLAGGAFLPVGEAADCGGSASPIPADCCSDAEDIVYCVLVCECV